MDINSNALLRIYFHCLHSTITSTSVKEKKFSHQDISNIWNICFKSSINNETNEGRFKIHKLLTQTVQIFKFKNIRNWLVWSTWFQRNTSFQDYFFWRWVIWAASNIYVDSFFWPLPAFFRGLSVVLRRTFLSNLVCLYLPYPSILLIMCQVSKYCHCHSGPYAIFSVQIPDIQKWFADIYVSDLHKCWFFNFHFLYPPSFNIMAASFHLILWSSS